MLQPVANGGICIPSSCIPHADISSFLQAVWYMEDSAEKDALKQLCEPSKVSTRTSCWLNVMHCIPANHLQCGLPWWDLLAVVLLLTACIVHCRWV